MSLEKSKRSAFIMGGVLVLSFAASSAVVDLLLPYLATGDVRSVVEQPEKLSDAGTIAGLAVVLVVLLLILTGISAYCMYKFFGEAYYGPRGATRWAVFGIIFGALVGAAQWFFPERLWVLKSVAQVLCVFVAFFLARWAVPLRRG